jgi:hypothetical protein
MVPAPAKGAENVDPLCTDGSGVQQRQFQVGFVLFAWEAAQFDAVRRQRRQSRIVERVEIADHQRWAKVRFHQRICTAIGGNHHIGVGDQRTVGVER